MMSMTVPSAVHTGSSNGRNDTAQQLKGRRRKGTPSILFLYPPPSIAHSEAVMYPRSLLMLFFPMVTHSHTPGHAKAGSQTLSRRLLRCRRLREVIAPIDEKLAAKQNRGSLISGSLAT